MKVVALVFGQVLGSFSVYLIKTEGNIVQAIFEWVHYKKNRQKFEIGSPFGPMTLNIILERTILQLSMEYQVQISH